MVLGLLLNTSAFSANKNVGTGEVTLSSSTVQHFIKYIKGGYGSKPGTFWITVDGDSPYYWTCGEGSCQSSGRERSACETYYGKECSLFAHRRTVKWQNGINSGHYKKSSIKRKWSDAEIRARLTEMGFLGGNTSSTTTTTPKTSKKVEKKKETKKLVKKYELKGERSIALSWEGYEELIAGTVNFDETDYKGTLNLPLPNNDGTCDGTYSLQKGGKGTWQIACSNNMGAAGTLKWVKDGGVTGTGRDHNDKKVKFTVSKNS